MNQIDMSVNGMEKTGCQKLDVFVRLYDHNALVFVLKKVSVSKVYRAMLFSYSQAVLKIVSTRAKRIF